MGYKRIKGQQKSCSDCRKLRSSCRAKRYMQFPAYWHALSQSLRKVLWWSCCLYNVRRV